MWRCKGQRYHDGLWPLAEHHMSQTITWYESAPGPLFWLQSSPAGSVGDLRLSAVEVGAQCQVYLRMWREAVVIGCWESLCGRSCTEAPGPVSYVHFPHCSLLVVIPFETIWGRSAENTVCRVCVELVYMVATCVYVSTAVYSCQCACVSVLFVCIFQSVTLKESDSGAWENVSAVCLLNWVSPLTLCWSCRH